MEDVRGYNGAYDPAVDHQTTPPPRERRPNAEGRPPSPPSPPPSGSNGGWALGDPDLRRKRRIAGYKGYAVGGKMKSSLRKSFRWIKNRILML
ncbi:unnamed protein product [Spirodela intermedia]|uniref:Uncharacterized protein n=1 Tax=Spirodela intermedia TaxID=51605 RepID=A0A7I8L117_SPIIN|nr:unnamed protein product [Spirodela intermedia]